MGLFSKFFSGNKPTDNISAARARAKQRVHEKEFSDTIPDNDPYRSGIDFVKGIQVNVTSDHYNTDSMPLDPEQENVISLIFDGFRPSIQHRATNGVGASINVASGVPTNLTAFDSLNKVIPTADVEYLAADYVWPTTHTRD